MAKFLETVFICLVIDITLSIAMMKHIPIGKKCLKKSGRNFSGKKLISLQQEQIQSFRKPYMIASDIDDDNKEKDLLQTNEKKTYTNKTNLRSQSFGACWSGNFIQRGPEIKNDDGSKASPIHTLILGTHPSIQSLAKHEYFGHPQNAFWWIAGDCLGFCRAIPKAENSQKEYALAQYLRYCTTNNVEDKNNNCSSNINILTYQQQVQTLTRNGFALWDLIQYCEREGSLDTNIRNETPNDIFDFCQTHPTIRRIVLANGQTQCKLFVKHFKEWWEDEIGQYNDEKDKLSNSSLPPLLIPADNLISRKAFGKRYSKRIDEDNDNDDFKGRRKIECVCMLGVSPANARYSYVEKRENWEKYCYLPGLKDKRVLMGLQTSFLK